MTCPKTKRKFEEVEQAVHSCIETLTGYEKCLLQNKLLQARSRMLKYENLAVVYEAQISMAKLDVEIATSDIDLLLQELQRGKRYKTGEAITTTTSTQTTSSPPESVYDTSRVSFELPSVDLTSLAIQRSGTGQEPCTASQAENVQKVTASLGENASCMSRRENSQVASTSQAENLQEFVISQGVNAQEFTEIQGENVQDFTTTQAENAHEFTTTQAENAQEFTASQEENSQVATTSQGKITSQDPNDSGCNLSPKCLVSQEIQVRLPSVNTKEDDTATLKNNKKCMAKKKIANEKLSTKDVLPNDKIKPKDKKIHEKPSKVNEKLPNTNETTKKIDNTRRKSVQMRQSQDRRTDGRKSDSYDRCNFAHSQKKTIDQCDSFRDSPKHREKAKGRKCSKEQCEDEKQIPNRNDKSTNEPRTRHTSRSQNIRPTNYGKSSDANKNYKINQDNRHREAKNNSEPGKKTNLNRRKNTDPIIKQNEPIKPNESDKVTYEPEPRSCDSTLVIAEQTFVVEGPLSKGRIEDSEPFNKPHDSPIHYTDFANTILSSVAIAETPDVTVGGLNSQSTIAQSTPIVRRFKTVDYSGSEFTDLPSNVLRSEPLVEDQLTTFIRTTLADYNRDVSELNLSPDNNTITNKDKKTSDEMIIKDKTTKTSNQNTSKQNLMVKIPVAKVPATVNRITTTAKQPCLTVTVNDAGVITIRPKSVENSNSPSPEQEKTEKEAYIQNTQDISFHSTTSPNSKKPIRTAEQILNSPDDLTFKRPVNTTAHNTEDIQKVTETASYMTEVKDQYYLDVNSPRLADEAPTHKNAVSLFRAFSLLMPPSPTFTVSSSSDKENCKSTIPSPPKVQKLPINRSILDDFVPSTFYSHRNDITTGFENDINPSHRNDSTSHKNDINANHKDNINTSNKNNFHTFNRNYINTSCKNNNNTSQRIDINTNRKNEINASHRNDINSCYNNDFHTYNTNYINTSFKNDNNISHRNDINFNRKNDIIASHRNDIINTSHRNDTHTSLKSDIHANQRNDIKNHRNEINNSHRNDIHTSLRSDIHANQRNDINYNHRNDIRHRNNIHTGYRNDNLTNYRNEINTYQRSNINTSYRNNNMNNNYINRKRIPVRRASIADALPRRTVKFTDAKPLPVKAKSTSATPKPRNRRKSLDDRAIVRILNEPLSSVSSKSGSPKSAGPTPKKDMNTSSDRLLYSLYKDIRMARCFKFTIKKSEQNCIYCGPVNEGHMCFFSLKQILEQC